MVNSLRQMFQGKWLFGIGIFFFIVSSAYVSGKEARAASAYNLTVKIKEENIEDTNNVEVKVTGSDNYEKTLSTNNTGLVRFKVLNNGNYTITPTKEGYRFDPSSKEVTLGKK